jgi:hypothetical protein
VEERASGHHQSKSFFTTRAPCWPARRLSSTDCAASATYVPSHSNLLLERAAATPLAAGAATRPASRHLIMIRPPPRPLWSACARCPGPGSSWGSVQPVRALHISPMVAGGASRTAAAPGQPLRRGACDDGGRSTVINRQRAAFFLRNWKRYAFVWLRRWRTNAGFDSKDPQLSDQVHKIGCAFDPPQFHNVNLEASAQPASRQAPFTEPSRSGHAGTAARATTRSAFSCARSTAR